MGDHYCKHNRKSSDTLTCWPTADKQHIKVERHRGSLTAVKIKEHWKCCGKLPFVSLEQDGQLFHDFGKLQLSYIISNNVNRKAEMHTVQTFI